MRVFKGHGASARARQTAQDGRIALWLTTDKDGKEVGWLYGGEHRLLEVGRVIYSRTGKVFVIAQVGTEHQHITVYQPQLKNAIKFAQFGEITDRERRSGG